MRRPVLTALLALLSTSLGTAALLTGGSTTRIVAMADCVTGVTCNATSPKFCQQPTSLYMCDTASGFYTVVASGGGGGSPGGSSTQVQTNCGGVFCGDPGLTYDTATDALTLGGGFVKPGLSTYLNDGTATLLPLKIDFTLANPTAAPTGMTTGSIGSCTNAGGEQYGLYILWANQSGETMMGPQALYTPTGASKLIQTITRPTPPAGATYWRPVYSKGTEGHQTVRACLTTAPLYAAIGTTTANCNCGAANAIFTNGANTTGPISMTDPRDGEIRFTSGTPTATTPSMTVGGNRIYTNQRVAQWSNDSGSTKVDIATWSTNVINVCKQGCRYSSVVAGAAAVTGNTTTNRFTVMIGPGDYDEDNIVVKPYVAYVGAGNAVTRIRGIPGNGVSETFDFDETTTENLFANMTIGGLGPLQGTEAVAGSGTRTVYVANVILGITDGSENGDKTIDGYLFSGARQTTIYETDSICFSVYDCLRMGGSGSATNRYFSSGSQYYMSGPYPVRSRVWSLSGARNEMFVTGFIVRGTYADDYPVHLLDVNPQSAGGTNTIALNAGEIYVEATNATRSTQLACVDLSNIDAGIGAGTVATIELTDVNCTLSSASASGTLYGLKVTTDANHANWKVNWHGGKIALSGGATRYDVDSSEGAAGFALTMTDVDHAGVYNGTGTVTAVDTRLAKFGRSLTIPVGALTCGAGTAGRIASHTTPLQYCDNAGTPALQYAAYGNSTGDATRVGTTPAGRSLTSTSGVLDADAELYTHTKDVAFDTPATSDSGIIQITFPLAVTITRVWCSTDTGTATIQFDERAEATPNTGGTDVLTSALVCDSNTEVTTSFANATIAANVPMNLDIDAVASAPAKLRIHIAFTADE